VPAVAPLTEGPSFTEQVVERRAAEGLVSGVEKRVALRQVVGPTQAALQFTPLGPDGKPEAASSFTAVVNENGTFEVVASGGKLPAGTYQVGLQTYCKLAGKYRALAPPGSPIRREPRPGWNDLTIDLAKAE
jgi:hypothetical protein